MMSFLRQITHAQWIMLSTLAVIALFMMMASRAEAYYYGPDPYATTIGHCGWIQAGNRLFYKNPRNVRIIQTKLERMGYSVGRPGVDGKYGPQTRRAVRQFQTDNSLAVDGSVGTQTATRLAYNSHPISNVQNCRRPYMGSH